MALLAQQQLLHVYIASLLMPSLFDFERLYLNHLFPGSKEMMLFTELPDWYT